MTKQQPEALQLADALVKITGVYPLEIKAAEELRRQHAHIAELQARAQELGRMARDCNTRRVLELEAQLEAVTQQWNQRNAAEHTAKAQLNATAVDWQVAAKTIAIQIAENCGTVPQLVFPHLYLGLKKLFDRPAQCLRQIAEPPR